MRMRTKKKRRVYEIMIYVSPHNNISQHMCFSLVTIMMVITIQMLSTLPEIFYLIDSRAIVIYNFFSFFSISHIVWHEWNGCTE